MTKLTQKSDRTYLQAAPAPLRHINSSTGPVSSLKGHVKAMSFGSYLLQRFYLTAALCHTAEPQVSACKLTGATLCCSAV